MAKANPSNEKPAVEPKVKAKAAKPKIITVGNIKKFTR